MVTVHPNVFHDLLETVPAAGWQVVERDGVVTVNLLGLRREAADLSRLEWAVRQALRQQGASVRDVRVQPVGQLVRGTTGKAPLVMRQTGAGHGRLTMRGGETYTVAAP